MPKLIAVHEIIRGAGAKREVISPKAEFDATEAERDELVALGAAAEVEGAEEVKLKATRSKKGAEPEAEDSVI